MTFSRQSDEIVFKKRLIKRKSLDPREVLEP